MSNGWDSLRFDIQSCKECEMAKTRKQAVIGRGSAKPLVLFIGEAPGEEEDNTGMPFVGRSGQVLMEEIKRIGLSPNEYYIANTVKCRPIRNETSVSGFIKVKNRAPTPEEVSKCMPFLNLQLILLQPEIVVCVGKIAEHAIDSLFVRPNCPSLNFIILRFIHPAVTLYKPKHYLILRVQFDNLKEKLEGLKRDAGIEGREG